MTDTTSHNLSSIQWGKLGSYDAYIWGEAKSIDRVKYRAIIYYPGQRTDEDAITGCSCQFPDCRHLEALSVAYRTEPDSFTQAQKLPDFVREWSKNLPDDVGEGDFVIVNERTRKEILHSELQKQARQRQRQETMQKQLQNLSRWLQTMLRDGLSTAHFQDYLIWQDQATQAANAHMKGVSRILRRIAYVCKHQPMGWVDDVRHDVSYLQLLIDAFTQFDQLSEAQQGDLRQVVGWNFKHDNIPDQYYVTDVWQPLSVEDLPQTYDKVTGRRVWLYGLQTERNAVLVEFAYKRAYFEPYGEDGNVFKACLMYYPSAYPLRAVVKDHMLTLGKERTYQGYANLAAFETAYRQSLSLNPWLDAFPVLLNNVQLAYLEGRWYLVDDEQRMLLLADTDERLWKVAGKFTNRRSTAFVIWNGTYASYRWLGSPDYQLKDMRLERWKP